MGFVRVWNKLRNYANINFLEISCRNIDKMFSIACWHFNLKNISVSFTVMNSLHSPTFSLAFTFIFTLTVSSLLASLRTFLLSNVSYAISCHQIHSNLRLLFLNVSSSVIGLFNTFLLILSTFYFNISCVVTKYV